VHEQLYQAARNVCLDDSLDLVVGAVGKVRDGPAGVDEDLVVKRVDELGENGKSRSDGVPVGLRGLATAEVAKRPGGILSMLSFLLSSRRRTRGARAP